MASINIYFFDPCDLKFDGWPWKTIGHLFYATSSFVHHFVTIWESNLELQSGKSKSGSKSANFCPSVNSNWKYNPEMLKSGQNRRYFVRWDLEIWQMILKNWRAPLLGCVKLCAWFRSHWWIQTGNTQIRSKSVIFLSCLNLKIDGWLWKTNEHLFYATSSFVHLFKAICEFKLSYSLETPKLGQNLFRSLWRWPLTFCMDITSVNSNKSWQFDDDMMTGTL